MKIQVKIRSRIRLYNFPSERSCVTRNGKHSEVQKYNTSREEHVDRDCYKSALHTGSTGPRKTRLNRVGIKARPRYKRT